MYTYTYIVYKYSIYKEKISPILSLSLYLSSSMTFRKRYIKLWVVLCASRQ